MRIPQYGIHNMIKYNKKRTVFKFCKRCGRPFYPRSNRQQFCDGGLITSVTGYVPRYSNIKYAPYGNYSTILEVNCKEEHNQQYQQDYQHRYYINNKNKLNDYSNEYQKTYKRVNKRPWKYWSDWYHIIDQSHRTKIRARNERRNNHRRQDFNQEYKAIQYLKWKAGLRCNFEDPNFEEDES